MAADVAERRTPVSSCCTCNCQVCKERYSKLQEKRNALRQALKLLEQQLDKIQADNLRLKKAYEAEKARAEIEKEGRDKEVAARAPLETEIASLKSEISLIQKKGVLHAQDRNEEVKCLQDLISEREKEINRVKDLLEKEKKRVDSEKKNASEEKKRAVEAWKFVKAEKGKADEERKIADVERKKAEEYRLQLEALSKEADDAKSKLVSGMLKLEEGNKKLEAVKQQVAKERKCADSEMAKAEEQRRLAEANRKQAEEEKFRAEKLSQQLKEASGRNEELEKKIHELVQSRYSSEVLGGKTNKVTNAEFSKMGQGLRVGSQTQSVLKSVEQGKRVEVEKQSTISKRKLAKAEMDKSLESRKLADQSQKKAMEDKYQADQLSQQVEDARGRIDALQKQIHDLSCSKKLVKASAVSPEKDSVTESVKVKDLKKRLKFEKMRVKHAKEVAKLEKSRNSILQQELGRLKLDFVQFMHRLDVLDKCFSPDAEYLGKKKVRDHSDKQMLKLKKTFSGLEPFQMYLQKEKELLKPYSTAITGSGPPKQSVHDIAPVLSLAGANCSESVSGIDSQDSRLESLLGDSSRKMLQSSAINSISASFSDGQLVGSQERGAFSVTTSSKLIEEGLNAEPTNSCMPGEVERMKCNGNHAVVAENSVRSPLKFGGVGSVGGPSRKRKRIADAIESIGSLRKLHLQMEEKMSDLHDMLNKKVEKHSKDANYRVPNVQENSYCKQDKFHEKRKTSHGESLGICNLSDSNELKMAAKADAKLHEDAFRQTSKPKTDLIGFARTFAEGISDSVISNLDKLPNMPFEEVANGDFMKLLDLDDPTDEERYRNAMEMPLSPTLPVICFQGDETVDVDKIEPLQEERFHSCLSNEKENPGLSCCSDVINVETNCNELNYVISGTSHCSSLHENEGPIDSFDVQGIDRNGLYSAVQTGEVCDHQALNFGMEMVISDVLGSRDEGVKMAESALGTACDNISNHFIVIHDIEDNSSISRIFCATRTCMARCSLATQKGSVLRIILLALKMEENLLSKEKACVFLSLLLINFSAAALGKSGHLLNNNFFLCLDAFHTDVSAVMSDAEARSVFNELCLDELLRVIENFLLDGRVLKYSQVSSSQVSIDCISKIHILLDGVDTLLSSEAASVDQLVAGSIILASICAATDHIGFICEASYNIFRMRWCDLSLSLTILHIFAYLGGEKYFVLREHNLTMTVLKSMVTCIERSSSVAETSCGSSARQVQAKFPPCNKCLFSKDAVSVDIAISLLLKEIQAYAESVTMNVLFHKDQAERSCLDLCCVFAKNCGASCSLNKSEIPAFQSDSVVNITSCHFSDTLSLVELLACNMNWDWTCTTILPELLRMLESAKQESFTVAVVILLGQLGRLGVDACGYEDKEVESLKSKLSAFLLRDTTIRAAFAVQIATVSALLRLISLDFEQIVQINAKHPIIDSQSAPADCIRKWFSLLSKERQAISFNLLRSSGVIEK